jgi:hypothetical protein
MNAERDSEEEAHDEDVGASDHFPLKQSGEVKVPHLPEPPRASEEKKIHRRRPLPLVPEGEDDPDPSSPEQTD